MSDRVTIFFPECRFDFIFLKRSIPHTVQEGKGLSFKMKDTVNMVAYLNVDKPLSPMFYRYL